jgi:5'-deoxynucleotidase YfbR-like HD superfamily hydrolase
MRFNHILQPEIIKRLDSVIRYSSIPVTHHELVSTHSYWVTMYALLIHRAIDGEDRLTSRLLISALIHDLSESKTGDVVRTFKYSSEPLKKEIDNAEELIVKSLPQEIQDLFSVHSDTKGIEAACNDTRYIKDIVKAADFVSLFRYMRKEAAMHNMEIIPFYNRMFTDLCTMSASMEVLSKTSGYAKHLRQLYETMIQDAQKVADDCFGKSFKDPYWNHPI